MKVKNIKIEDLKSIKSEKKQMKGGFENKIFLEYVEEKDIDKER